MPTRTAVRGLQLTELERRKVVDSYRLAYISEELVNWCPGLGTVLANEEITADGRSDIGNYPVYRRPLRQWMLRITAYAQRLIDDLDHLDWPESIKLIQRNWIGPSDGANVEFRVNGTPELTIRVFTTRPDTLPGATYMVLAPEHPMVDALVTNAWPADTRQEWRYLAGQEQAGDEIGNAGQARGAAGERASGRARTPDRHLDACRRGPRLPANDVQLGERDRAHGSYAKTGVFTGSYVLNPMTGEPIPVFIADYVLMGYGTGAIMAVPAHDERDLEFAQRYRLPVRAVLHPPAAWFERRGIPADTPAGQWPEAFVGDEGYLGSAVPGLDLTGLDKSAGIEAAARWLERPRRRPACAFVPVAGLAVLPAALLGRAIPDRLRRARAACSTPGRDAARPASRNDRIPPAPPGRTSPATRSRRSPAPRSGWKPNWTLATASSDTAARPTPCRSGPGRAGTTSAISTRPTTNAWWIPRWSGTGWCRPERRTAADGGVDLYIGGVEHAVLHLLYARFWHKVLYDLGHVSTREPFRRLLNQGYILADAFTDSRGMYVPAAEVVERRGRPVPLPGRAGGPPGGEDGQEQEEQREP